METRGKGGQLYPLGRKERKEGESKGSHNRGKEWVAFLIVHLATLAPSAVFFWTCSCPERATYQVLSGMSLSDAEKMQ
jgi:hypothetical protein